jgi:hypothetical protein
MRPCPMKNADNSAMMSSASFKRILAKKQNIA